MSNLVPFFVCVFVCLCLYSSLDSSPHHTAYPRIHQYVKEDTITSFAFNHRPIICCNKETRQNVFVPNVVHCKHVHF